jgi:HSP20 family molecular chaperone IbpA
MLPDNRDELFRIIATLMDDLSSGEGPSPERWFRGYAIIASPGGIPTVIRIFPEDYRENSWELAEGEGKVYITAQLPAGTGSEPSVSFQPFEVRISFQGETWVVTLPVRIDVRSCSCHVKNGVLDITCRKA